MPRLLHATHTSTLSCPPETYIYDLARATSTTLAAISSDDSLRTFSTSTLALQGVLENTHAGVTCMQSVGENLVATAGRDGEAKLWDVRGGRPIVFQCGLPVLSLAANASAGVIAAGTELVGSGARVIIWDLRTTGVKVQYTESHNDDVTTLSFHPTTPHLLLSGSTDALVNVYNLLTPPSGSAGTPDDDVDDALHQVINHGSSVHRAGFMAADGSGHGDVFAISHDEQLAVYTLFDAIPEEDEVQEAEKRVWGDVRRLLDCEYVVDVVPRHGGGGWVVAGNCGEGWLDLVGIGNKGGGIGGWDIGGERVRLVGGHGGEVVRGVYSDERAGLIYSAGEDGLVKVWREPGGGGGGGGGGGEGERATTEETGESSASAERADRKRTKEERRERREKKKEEAKGRFKPY